jgi:UDP-galactopyranose mutase
VYTGPIDEFFGHSAGQLGWRSLRFETSVEPIPDYQGAAQINFSNREVPYQRICEYRHFTPPPPDKLTKTVIVKEYPLPYDPTHGYDAFYPVNSPADQVKIEQYRRLARKLEQSSKIYFGGRLGTYRYLNMEQAIRSAWDLTDRIFSA